MPASAPAPGFVEVDPGWCAPEGGAFLSWPGVDAELRRRREERAQCEVRIATAEEQRDINGARATKAEHDAAAERSWWHDVGWPLVVGIGAALVGGGAGYAIGSHAHK